MELSRKTLCRLLGVEPTAPEKPLLSAHPLVAFAFIKHMWESGQQVSGAVCFAASVSVWVCKLLLTWRFQLQVAGYTDLSFGVSKPQHYNRVPLSRLAIYNGVMSR